MVRSYLVVAEVKKSVARAYKRRCKAQNRVLLFLCVIVEILEKSCIIFILFETVTLFLLHIRHYSKCFININSFNLGHQG